VETITSRTVLHKGVNCFEFLVLSPHPLDWLYAQLAALDPERSCVRDLHEVGGADEQAPDKAVPIVVSPLIRVRSEAIDELMAEVGEMRTTLASLGTILRDGRNGQAWEGISK